LPLLQLGYARLLYKRLGYFDYIRSLTRKRIFIYTLKNSEK
jgi:hypothetical protein